jgi:hypothetical protein
MCQCFCSLINFNFVIFFIKGDCFFSVTKSVCHTKNNLVAPLTFNASQGVPSKIIFMIWLNLDKHSIFFRFFFCYAFKSPNYCLLPSLFEGFQQEMFLSVSEFSQFLPSARQQSCRRRPMKTYLTPPPAHLHFTEFPEKVTSATHVT